MNIFYDENMPFAAEFFAEMGETTPFSGRTVTARELANADILLVRSITPVNEALLASNQGLTFVGSATIGFDHIDLDYLSQRNIPFSSAPGCNAISVAEYVVSALAVLAQKYQYNLQDKTVSIVGAGNTGSRLSERLTALGVTHMLCDPLLEHDGDSRTFVSLEQALKADIISLHVPLTRQGEHKTYHLINADRLSTLSSNQTIINACRGEVIDNQALLALKKQGHKLSVVLDVWENEPQVLTELIDYTDLATAHIAGYSLEGKSRGTEMLYQAACKILGFKVTKSLSDFLPKPWLHNIEIEKPLNFAEQLKLMQLTYDVRRDDAIFRHNLADKGFDTLRKTYPVRRENSALTITSENLAVQKQLASLGFTCKY